MDPDARAAAHAAQLASPSYRLAALDQDFLLGPSMRGVRFLLEFAKAYADQNESDFAALRDAAAAGRIEARSGL